MSQNYDAAPREYLNEGLASIEAIGESTGNADYDIARAGLGVGGSYFLEQQLPGGRPPEGAASWSAQDDEGQLSLVEKIVRYNATHEDKILIEDYL